MADVNYTGKIRKDEKEKPAKKPKKKKEEDE